jgi:hypothetical protein
MSAEDEAGMGMSRSAAAPWAIGQRGGDDGTGELVKAWGSASPMVVVRPRTGAG